MGYLTQNGLKIAGFLTKCPQVPLAPLAAFSRSASVPGAANEGHGEYKRLHKFPTEHTCSSMSLGGINLTCKLLACFTWFFTTCKHPQIKLIREGLKKKCEIWAFGLILLFKNDIIAPKHFNKALR